MTHPTTIDEYRAHLQQIQDPQDIDALCLGAVFTGILANPAPSTGTILEVRHWLGAGLFGPTVYTHVKLCTACAHQPGGDACLNSEQADEHQVLHVEKIERNGDGTP